MCIYMGDAYAKRARKQKKIGGDVLTGGRKLSNENFPYPTQWLEQENHGKYTNVIICTTAIVEI